jgi:hypothetical protein
MQRFMIGELVNIGRTVPYCTHDNKRIDPRAVYVIEQYRPGNSVNVYWCSLVFGDGPEELPVLSTYLHRLEKSPLAIEGAGASGGRG